MHPASTDDLIGSLIRLSSEKGWSQADLAGRLGVSQGHLSKLLRGKHAVGLRIGAKIREITQRSIMSDSEWLAAISAAASRSDDFRDAVDALLRIMHIDAPR